MQCERNGYRMSWTLFSMLRRLGQKLGQFFQRRVFLVLQLRAAAHSAQVNLGVAFLARLVTES